MDVTISQSEIVVSVGSQGLSRTLNTSDTSATVTSNDVQAVVSPSPVSVTVGQTETPVTIVGVQGPMGPQGLPGDIVSSVTKTAGESLASYRVVRANSLGEVLYASASNTSHMNSVLGVTITSASAGEDVDIRTSGDVWFNGWSWNPLYPVFLSTNGLLSQTAPESGFLCQVGVASSENTLHVRIGQQYSLGG